MMKNLSLSKSSSAIDEALIYKKNDKNKVKFLDSF